MRMERQQAGSGVRYFLFAGLSVGWLVGLSASPVLAPVLGAILGASAGLFAGAKLKSALGDSLDPKPVAGVLIGMALAAPVGVLVRTHELLEPDRPPLSRAQAPQEDKEANLAAKQGALFAAETEACSRLLGSSPERLRDALQTSSQAWARVLEARISDEALLRQMVEETCGDSLN
jgi:hypothetical protein